jgi:hypothetical protein
MCIPVQSKLFRLALDEANRYKWIESEKAGRDLGEQAIREWSRRYWHGWCRARWIEHLSGEKYWEELDHEDFGLLKKQFHPNTALIAEIVEKIKAGGENLDIIQWCIKENRNLKDALEILQKLDINSRRISFWP